MEEAMILFLGQEPQQTNLYISTDWVCSLLSCIDFAWVFALADGWASLEFSSK